MAGLGAVEEALGPPLLEDLTVGAKHRGDNLRVARQSPYGLDGQGLTAQREPRAAAALLQLGEPDRHHETGLGLARHTLRGTCRPAHQLDQRVRPTRTRGPRVVVTGLRVLLRLGQRIDGAVDDRRSLVIQHQRVAPHPQRALALVQRAVCAANLRLVLHQSVRSQHVGRATQCDRQRLLGHPVLTAGTPQQRADCVLELLGLRQGSNTAVEPRDHRPLGHG